MLSWQLHQEDMLFGEPVNPEMLLYSWAAEPVEMVSAEQPVPPRFILRSQLKPAEPRFKRVILLLSVRFSDFSRIRRLLR